MSSHPLDSNTIQPLIFPHLWKSQRGVASVAAAETNPLFELYKRSKAISGPLGEARDQGAAARRLQVKIPETVIIRRLPQSWYHYDTDQNCIRKRTKDLSREQILKVFTIDIPARRKAKGLKPCEILAQFLASGDSQGGPEDCVVFLNASNLEKFLFANPPRYSGILQEFILPRGSQNELLQAVWAPSLLTISKRINRNSLGDLHLPAFDRCVTFEGPSHLSRDAVTGPGVRVKLQGVVTWFVSHLKALDASVSVGRAVIYAKVDPMECDVVWLLYTSSLRMVDTLADRSSGVASPLPPIALTMGSTTLRAGGTLGGAISSDASRFDALRLTFTNSDGVAAVERKVFDEQAPPSSRFPAEPSSRPLSRARTPLAAYGEPADLLPEDAIDIDKHPNSSAIVRLRMAQQATALKRADKAAEDLLWVASNFNEVPAHEYVKPSRALARAHTRDLHGFGRDAAAAYKSECESAQVPAETPQKVSVPPNVLQSSTAMPALPGSTSSPSPPKPHTAVAGDMGVPAELRLSLDRTSANVQTNTEKAQLVARQNATISNISAAMAEVSKSLSDRIDVITRREAGCNRPTVMLRKQEGSRHPQRKTSYASASSENSAASHQSTRMSIARMLAAAPIFESSQTLATTPAAAKADAALVRHSLLDQYDRLLSLKSADTERLQAAKKALAAAEKEAEIRKQKAAVAKEQRRKSYVSPNMNFLPPPVAVNSSPTPAKTVVVPIGKQNNLWYHSIPPIPSLSILTKHELGSSICLGSHPDALSLSFHASVQRAGSFGLESTVSASVDAVPWHFCPPLQTPRHSLQGELPSWYHRKLSDFTLFHFTIPASNGGEAAPASAEPSVVFAAVYPPNTSANSLVSKMNIVWAAQDKIVESIGTEAASLLAEVLSTSYYTPSIPEAEASISPSMVSLSDSMPPTLRAIRHMRALAARLREPSSKSAELKSPEVSGSMDKILDGEVYASRSPNALAPLSSKSLRLITTATGSSLLRYANVGKDLQTLSRAAAKELEARAGQGSRRLRRRRVQPETTSSTSVGAVDEAKPHDVIRPDSSAAEVQLHEPFNTSNSTSSVMAGDLQRGSHSDSSLPSTDVIRGGSFGAWADVDKSGVVESVVDRSEILGALDAVRDCSYRYRPSVVLRPPVAFQLVSYLACDLGRTVELVDVASGATMTWKELRDRAISIPAREDHADLVALRPCVTPDEQRQNAHHLFKHICEYLEFVCLLLFCISEGPPADSSTASSGSVTSCDLLLRILPSNVATKLLGSISEIQGILATKIFSQERSILDTFQFLCSIQDAGMSRYVQKIPSERVSAHPTPTQGLKLAVSYESVLDEDVAEGNSPHAETVPEISMHLDEDGTEPQPQYNLIVDDMVYLTPSSADTERVGSASENTGANVLPISMVLLESMNVSFSGNVEIPRDIGDRRAFADCLASQLHEALDFGATSSPVAASSGTYPFSPRSASGASPAVKNLLQRSDELLKYCPEDVAYLGILCSLAASEGLAPLGLSTVVAAEAQWGSSTVAYVHRRLEEAK